MSLLLVAFPTDYPKLLNCPLALSLTAIAPSVNVPIVRKQHKNLEVLWNFSIYKWNIEESQELTFLNFVRQFNV